LHVAFCPSAYGITKTELLELVQKGVAPSLIVSLIDKDCVDFEVDASAVLELAETVPNDVIEAAIACRRRIHTLETPSTPPGTAPDASEISLAEAPALALQDVRTIAVVPL
jgi:hypothetical protein